MAGRKKTVRTEDEPKQDKADNRKKFTKDNAKDFGAKGGQISGEVRRRKKNMREMARALLDLPITSADTKKKLESLGIDAEDTTNQMALLVRMMQSALVDGDVKAATFLRDTAGYDNATMARMGFDTEEEEEDGLVIYIPDNGRQADVQVVALEETGLIIEEPTKAGDSDGSEGN